MSKSEVKRTRRVQTREFRAETVQPQKPGDDAKTAMAEQLLTISRSVVAEAPRPEWDESSLPRPTNSLRAPTPTRRAARSRGPRTRPRPWPRLRGQRRRERPSRLRERLAS